MSHLDAIAARLESIAQVRPDVPLARHTTFGIGGPADLFVTVESTESLAGVARIASDAGLPTFVLGSGSNILVSDAGIRGIVIDNRARAEADDGDGLFRVESGMSFAGFARKMCRRGLAGLAWAVGIPGTLGGAAVYNAGAYGGCLGDVLRRVHVYDAAAERDEWIDAADLGLVYRASAFTRGALGSRVILAAEVGLTPGDSVALLDEAAGYDRRRLTAQPRGRNAGSMFKNPTEQPAWKLIEAVGMRGARRGDAAISDQHCNFFVNHGQAKGSDVASLVFEAARRVHEQFGIRLEREVAFVGDWG